MKEEHTHFGYQTVAVNDKAAKVKQVFSSVAEQYDIMNDVMSFGLHRVWKQLAIKHLSLRAGHQVLDLAGGTGDLTRLISPIIGPSGTVVLSDINEDMLKVGKARLLNQGLYKNIEIQAANAEHLPFDDYQFDRVIIGFGLRNVTQKEQALKEMYRVLNPGGQLIVLEFSHPTHGSLQKLYDLYSFNLLPLMGKLIAKDADSYQYLAESIRMHPNQDTLKEMLDHAGFDQARFFNLSGGIVAIHQGYKY